MDALDIIDDTEPEDLEGDERDAVEELVHRVEQEGQPLAEALGVSEAFLETLEFHAHRLYRAGRYDDAGVIVDALLALDDRRYYPYLLAGDVAMEKERWEEAVQCLGAALECGPESTMIEGKLGEALFRVGRTEAAARHLERVLELADVEDDPYARRARVLLGLRDEPDTEGTASGSDRTAS